IQLQLPQVPPENIIAEPQKRDTALAMLVGTIYAQTLDEKAVVINCASDHIVEDEAEFLRVMRAAAEIAANEPYLVTVGITPTRPATGFGYIRIGSDIKRIDRTLTMFDVDSFTEKPNHATAQAFISTGKYFWNANMYVWAAKTLSQSFKLLMPTMFELTTPLSTAKAGKFQSMLPAIYTEAESISIDYAISEKADNLVLLPGDFGWNDVGDWKVVYELGTKNFDNNVIIGDEDSLPAMTVKSQGNLIHTNGRLIALYGINDMIIIDTPEILMLIPKDESQDVKKLVERLKEEKRPEYL
ncbi:mannose-1-phosphate guanylyltransferase, partial [Candidatus Woesebacteria bacterium]|nr:mannose-1-phosphate guanylyltransferase [Candidatus Woesebacteria bacterium]